MTFWYAAAYFVLFFTYPAILFPKYFNYRNNQKLSEYFASIYVQKLAKILFYATGSRIKVRGLKNVPENGPVLFISNHQGHMDSLILHGFIKKPKSFVTITEYKKAPMLRTWMKYMGCVFIDRSDIRQQFFCINEATEKLKGGSSMVVFPEGKLNDGKETFKFQKGWLRMAVNSGVPIVPVTINNSYKVLSYNGRRVRPTKVECIISEPIYATGLKKAQEQEFVEKLRDIILSNLVA